MYVYVINISERESIAKAAVQWVERKDHCLVLYVYYIKIVKQKVWVKSEKEISTSIDESWFSQLESTVYKIL